MPTGLWLLIIANFVLIAWYCRSAGGKSFWLLPASFFIINYGFQYPLRSIFVSTVTSDVNVSPQEVFSAMVYSTLFLLIFLGVSLAAYSHKAVKPIPVSSTMCGSARREVTVVVIITAFLVLFLAYKWQSHQMFTLGDSAGQDSGSLIYNISNTCQTLSLFGFPLGVMLYHRYRNRVALVCVLVMAGLGLGGSVIAGGKGTVVTLAFAYLASSAASGSAPKLRTVCALALVSIAVGVFTYLLRAYGTVQGPSSGEIVQRSVNSAWAAAADKDRVVNVGLRNSADRFNYLDGLILSMRRPKASVLTADDYAYGSAVELLNFVPRQLFPRRMMYNFSWNTTSAVFGLPFDMMSPIGRIGESFYVLGYFGLIYAVLTALLFAWLLNRIFCRARTLVGRAVYVFILCAYVIPDDSLFFNARVLAFLLPLIGLSTLWVYPTRRTRAPVRRGVTTGQVIS